MIISEKRQILCNSSILSSEKYLVDNRPIELDDFFSCVETKVAIDSTLRLLEYNTADH